MNFNLAPKLTCIEICSGAGGQALGLEMAGFEALAHVENDVHACATLRQNRPEWNVFEQDIREFSAKKYQGVDLLAGGVPCPHFLKLTSNLVPRTSVIFFLKRSDWLRSVGQKR